MIQATPVRTGDRTLLAAGFILIYAFVVTWADNFVRTVAAEAGLWQFHLTRTLFALAILTALSPILGLRLIPRRFGSVVLRSLIQAMATLIYFGCLGFLSVGETLAGLYTAPIFVLIFSRYLFGKPIGPMLVLAVALGFVGALMVLDVRPGADFRLVSLVPIASGAFYALGNMATREWCEGESAATLLTGFFVALGLVSSGAMAVLAVWQPEVPAGPEGFVLRGLVWPSSSFWFWTFIQAAASSLGVGLTARAYQMADASRVAVFEYVLLPMGLFWTWMVWGDRVGMIAIAGVVLIFAAGLIIAGQRRR